MNKIEKTEQKKKQNIKNKKEVSKKRIKNEKQKTKQKKIIDYNFEISHKNEKRKNEKNIFYLIIQTLIIEDFLVQKCYSKKKKLQKF